MRKVSSYLQLKKTYPISSSYRSRNCCAWYFSSYLGEEKKIVNRIQIKLYNRKLENKWKIQTYQ